MGPEFCGAEVGDGVELVVAVPDMISNASTQTHDAWEDVPFVPVTSIASLWLPEARPVMEYCLACGTSVAAYVSTALFKTSST